MRFSLRNFIYVNGIVWLPISASAKTCNLTAFPSLNCGVKGWLDAPDPVGAAKAKSVEDCASQCLAIDKCKSFRYIQGKGQKCYFFGKYLGDMYLDSYNYQPGILYNRQCFTTDCDVIKAYSMVKTCKIVDITYYIDNYYPDFTWYYSLYACNLGHTAVPYKRNFHQKRYLYSGKTTPCDAATACANDTGTGSFDLHYYKPTQMWECVSYDNEDQYFDPSYYDQRITPGRYSRPNDSVAQGFGYYLSRYEYDGD